jgi:hypothetical protein
VWWSPVSEIALAVAQHTFLAGMTTILQRIIRKTRNETYQYFSHFFLGCILLFTGISIPGQGRFITKIELAGIKKQVRINSSEWEAFEIGKSGDVSGLIILSAYGFSYLSISRI